MLLIKKILQSLHEKLPGRKIYFIYTHRNGFDRFYYGLKANTEISYFSYTALKQQFPKVTFLKLQNENPQLIAKIKSDDVVIGHVGETFLKASEKTKRMIAFYPWAGHSDRSENQLFNCLSVQEEWNYLEKAQSIILLTSEYNVHEFVNQKKNFWHEYFEKIKKYKNVRFVHQPIDTTIFKRIKFEYTTSNFLYIGNNAHMKCLDDSKRLVASVDRQFHIYGVDQKRLDNRDQKAVNQLIQEADFFIQPGMWEGQCVSILEAASRGFIPVVSKETGYPYDHPFLLKFNDFTYNQAVLKKLLKLPPVERKQLADTLHQKLLEDKNHNNWNQLTEVLVNEVNALWNLSSL